MMPPSAAVRVSRDGRGYEHYYLVSLPRAGQARRRLLYWFRTPPNVKVGRQPFERDVQQLIEAQHPDVLVDWSQVPSLAVPPPDVERWRERRRERAAARRAVAEEETRERAEPATIPPDVDGESSSAEAAAGEIDELPEELPAADPALVALAPPDPAPSDGTSGEAAVAGGGRHRRRRRRRRRGGGTGAPGTVVAGGPDAGGLGETLEPEAGAGAEEPGAAGGEAAD